MKKIFKFGLRIFKRIYFQITLKRIHFHLIRTSKRKGKNEEPFLENKGHCPICDSDVIFTADRDWLRESYVCTHCDSIPRERALMYVIQTLFPNWQKLTIHESSPVKKGASMRLAALCGDYIASQFFPNETMGSMVAGVRCENLEQMTFANESIDLHITQDVMEHVFHPSKVWKEIERTLKPGGAHIFTVPLVNKANPSSLRAKMDENGQITYLCPAEYHGNPISKEGTLVTIDWGFDICNHIFKSCGLYTQIFHIDDLSQGIRSEYIEVLVTYKPLNTTPPQEIP